MVILFSTSQRKSGERLQRIVEAVVSEKNVKIYRTIDALSGGLRQPRNDVSVALLLASSKIDLHELISLRDLLWDIKIILILPDSDPETIAKGHILRPRFLSDCDSNFQDVAAVLSRMIKNSVTDKKTERASGIEKSMKRLSHCGLQSRNGQGG
jgi:hypothetical protein